MDLTMNLSNDEYQLRKIFEIFIFEYTTEQFIAYFRLQIYQI